MEVKDWILLFIPIISNGLIIFLVQFFVTEKYKKEQDKKQLRNETYKCLYNKLQLLTTGSLELYLQKQKIQEFDKDIEQKNSAMEELLIFCYSNHMAFKDMNFRVDDIKKSWDDLYSSWSNHRTPFFQNKDCLSLDANIYVELVDLIMVWKACAELLKSHIINKL